MEIPWQQDDIKVYGKVYPQPRLTALFGNEGKSYSYSNITMHPHKWSPLLMSIKEKVEKQQKQFILRYYLIIIVTAKTVTDGMPTMKKN